MAQFNFKVSDVPASTDNSFGPLPAGRYRLVILEADIHLTKRAKENNDPNLGQYVKAKLQVASGQYQNRLVWQNFNVVNANPKAAEIGNQQFSNLVSSAGLLEIQDTSQLCGLVVDGEIKVTPDTGYGEGNEVKRFYTAGPAPAQTEAPAPSGDGGPVAF
jgi:hypothetical protein